MPRSLAKFLISTVASPANSEIPIPGPTMLLPERDLDEGIDEAVFSLEPLLMCAERDERDRLEDPGGAA